MCDRPRGTGEDQSWLAGPLQQLIDAVSEKMATTKGLVLAHTIQ